MKCMSGQSDVCLCLNNYIVLVTECICDFTEISVDPLMFVAHLTL